MKSLLLIKGRGVKTPLHQQSLNIEQENSITEGDEEELWPSLVQNAFPSL